VANVVEKARPAMYYTTNIVQIDYIHETVFETTRAKEQELEISIKLRIDSIVVPYTPGLLQVLKHGWIQYFSTFMFVGVILGYLYDLLLTRQVMKTIVTVHGDSNPPFIKVKY
jgi:hypothetical protein